MIRQITPRQLAFLTAKGDEVLFGGAAGGGKSYGQVIDALYFALQYKGSRQLVLRRTYPELERSLIRTATQLYPRSVCRYNQQKKSISFSCGSVIDFGYCDSEGDVVRYQSVEYDVIRFDELTHFTEYMYLYLLSRLRGANPFPKQMKSTTNPGGIGHNWVRARFIDPAPPDTLWQGPTGSRIFLPSRIDDNVFLMKEDPGYKQRLENLPEKEQKALLYGDWDILSGRYFSGFDPGVHVCSGDGVPPEGAQVYRTIDYGLDRLVCLWMWMDSRGKGVVFREFCASGLVISAAAQEILRHSREEAVCTMAPPDLWSRQRESGITTADWFARCNVPLVRAPNRRVDGWRMVKEWLQKEKDGTPKLTVHDSCRELIRCMGTICHSEIHPDDCAITPHELTHAPDALRYLVASGIWQAVSGWEEESERSFLTYGT